MFGNSLGGDEIIETTNLYSDGSELIISNNGIEQLKINSTGAGFQIDPSEELHIYRSSGQCKLRVENDNGYANYGLTSDGYAVINNNVSGKSIKIASEGTTLIHFVPEQSSGSVKIVDIVTPPSVTTDKLYNVGGTLTWNGTGVGGGGVSDHTLLTNIGTNTHAQIDTHIASTVNPHSLDIDDVTPTTTKGDIIVENGTNAIRLAVGTNDYVLMADSGEASGVKWSASSGGVFTDDASYIYYTGGLNVGIGTATPDKTLHLYEAQATIKLQDASTTSTVHLDGSSNLCLETEDDKEIRLFTNNTKRMTIDNNGGILIGTGTGTNYDLELEGDDAYKLTTSTWGTTSSRKFKENIVDVTDMDCCDKIKELSFKTYNFNEASKVISNKMNTTKPQFGLIADEVRLLFPDAVNDKDIFDENKNIVDTYEVLNYHELFVSNLSATKELIKIVELLKARIDVLEGN